MQDWGKFDKAIESLLVEVDRCLSQPKCDNYSRRTLFGKLELLRLDIEEYFEKDNNFKATDLIERIDKITPRLKLVPLKSPHHFFVWVDLIFRFCAICAGFVLVGAFCSLPIIFLRSCEEFLGVDSRFSYAESLRRSVSWLLLGLLGISVDIVGLDENTFGDSCAILTFSHASNIDGFLLSGTCPIRHFGLGKKELFMVPFFAWISLAVGGVPVDRNNRDRAVNALKRSTDAAKNGKMCIMIAPEGTRSTSGQLMEFKKGAFHMCEQLQCPVVPVVMHAFDLFPKKSWVNTPGKVIIEYLTPVKYDPKQTRDQMMREVRRRMLEATMKPFPQLGAPLTWGERVRNLALCGSVFAVDAAIAWASSHFFFDILKMSVLGATAAVVGGTAAVTVGLYVYYVYIIDLIRGGGRKASGREKRD